MSADDDVDDVDDAIERALGVPRATSWPKLPGHGADLGDVRAYLTQAAQLPLGWKVEKATRHGRYGSDALSITIRTPGDARNLEVYFEAQRDCSKPSALRGALIEATAGASRMKYPKTAEASDFYMMACALADLVDNATYADEAREWIIEYVGLGNVVTLALSDPTARYDALVSLRARPEFTGKQARRYAANELDPRELWTVVLDGDEFWLRAGELASYLRFVVGVGALPQHALDARVNELGAQRTRLEENRRNGGGGHMALVFYRFPSVQAFPSVIRP